MSNESEGRNRARKFRKDHNLGSGPLGDLVEILAETVDVDVLVMSVPEGDEHGLTMTDPERGATVIAVATQNSSGRQRSSIAHELAHFLWSDHQEADEHGGPSPVETRANAFARHLLLPIDGVKAAYRPDQSLDQNLSRIVQRFDVSPHIAAIQLKEAHLINQQQCDEAKAVTARALATKHGWLDQYQERSIEAQQTRAPQRLVERAVKGYEAGFVTVAELSDWMGMRTEELAATLSEAGIHPPPVTSAEGDDHIADDPLPPIP